MKCEHSFSTVRCRKCGIPNPIAVAELVEQVAAQHMQECRRGAECTFVKTLRSAAADLRALERFIAREDPPRGGS